MENKNSRPLRVPTNPDNIFNDPWNVGVFTGTVVGLSLSYLIGGQAYPFVRRIFGAVLTGETKLALVVNAELKMGKGKIASQCSHGAVLSYSSMKAPYTRYKHGLGLLTSWQLAGQPKVVLRAPDATSLLELEQVAKKYRIPVSKVYDAGRTQVEPNSLTVLAVGPAPVLLIDQITGHLRLL